MRTGLVLNSCFFGFYAHFGFARTLERAAVDLHAFGGSSAGAVVAACMASGLGAEAGVSLALGLTAPDFWDPDSVLGSFARLGPVRGERFERILEERLPVARIEDCPRPLVVATTALPLLGPVLLTQGPLARAVRASCAVPLILQPVRIGRRLLVDGGVVTEAPLRALARRYPLERAIVHVAGWERRGGLPPIDPGLKRQIAWARARGVEVSVTRTVYPRLEPDRLERAGEAVACGERSALRWLARALSVLLVVLLVGCRSEDAGAATTAAPRSSPIAARTPAPETPPSGAIVIKGSKPDAGTTSRPSADARSAEEQERIARLESSLASSQGASPKNRPTAESAPRTVTVSDDPPPSSFNILFVGNSYTFVNDLPAMLTNVARSKHVDVAVDSVVQGGATLTQHLQNPAVLAKIRQGGWTHVVLQAQSVEPLTDPAGFESAGAALADEARKAGARPVFYETWARRAGDVVYKERWSGGDPATMQSRLQAEYRKVATASDALLIPAGDAFSKVVTSLPPIDLFDPDGSHPSLAGTYLVACVFHGALTRHSPVGARLPHGLSPDDADRLQGVAAEMAGLSH